MEIDLEFKQITMEYGPWDVCPKVDLNLTVTRDQNKDICISEAFVDVYHPETGLMVDQVELDLDKDWEQFDYLMASIEMKVQEYEYEHSHWLGGSDMDPQTITVRIETHYGRKTVYPVCEQAKLFTSIAKTVTLTPAMLEYIQKLGFEVEVLATSLPEAPK